MCGCSLRIGCPEGKSLHSEEQLWMLLGESMCYFTNTTETRGLSIGIR